MKSITIATTVLICLLMCYACGNRSSSKDNELEYENADDLGKSLLKVNDKLFSIPPPFQVASLVRRMNLPYNKELLNSTKGLENYSTNLKKALNMGVYGANLGYIQMYEQFPDATLYFAALKQLSKDLGINQYADEKILERIEKNSTNKDSLLHIMSDLYRDIDTYLMNSERNIIGVLILAGGWIESLYLLSNSTNEKDRKQLVQKIGEQKYSLDNLIALLRPYYGTHSDELTRFIQSLIDLAAIYDGVAVKYIYHEPTILSNKKLTLINSTTKLVITDYQLNAIADSISQIRRRLVSE